jgi:HSP20 family protein
MSDLIVVAFPGEDTVDQVLNRLQALQKEHLIDLEDAFVLEAELPGFTTEDLDIELVENRLTLRGERKAPSDVKEEQYRRHERAYGRFERSFLLPAVIDRDKVTAEMHHGVLTLRLAKSDLAKPKRIPIADAAGAHAR